MRQLSLALCLASALAVFAQPEETPPWRIVSITRNGFRPDAKRDKKGNVVFDGEKPVALLDAKGKLATYVADEGSRMVLEVSKGKRRFWDRYLWVTVRFDKAPGRVTDFAITDAEGKKLGLFRDAVRAIGPKALPEGQHVLVFERVPFPDRGIGKPLDLGSMVRMAPAEREWISWNGFHLSGLEHKAPLVVAGGVKKK
jgi:hypothetical protein